MEKTFLYLVGLVIFILLLRLFEDKLMGLFGKPESLSYKRKDFLLTVVEREFFEGLQKIIPNNYVIFPQVVLSSILNVDSPQREFWSHQNKINKKTIDFVVFDKPYYRPILAIEYDDSSHKRTKRQKRDDFVNESLKTAGIKIIHIKHEKNINFEAIKEELNNVLKIC
jgi:hypothetical protein